MGITPSYRQSLLEHKHLISNNIRQKQHNDAKATIECYNPGDLLIVLNEKREIGKCPKLQPVFEGPVVIT